jgi:aryl-phospho-beta-D-glucosidase BglC (GH1 family)
MSLRRTSAAKWRSAAAFCVLLLASISFSVSSHAQTLPTAQQVASNITVGWNLGNTLEAQCGETAWGNPAVSQAFVDSVRQAGFNSIRIPAAWNCHTNPAGSNTIDAAWMARVKQVVDYAYNQGMYVILNIHWDGGWLEEHPLFANQAANNVKQAAFWTQIATTFQGYNERMLFAGTNEVHADYGTPTTEHITVQQSYNQTFVNAVRATGGNNASRTLVVQTYNTNMWHGLNYFTLPTDTIAGRLMVEVHHYDPYDFTLNQSGSCLYWGAQFPTQANCTWANEAYHDDLFSQVGNRWVDQGVPVIIGEYGVATRPNVSLEARAFWNEYVNRAATANGIKTYYWDNGVLPSQTNGFAIFDRSTGAIVDSALLEAILRGSGVGNPTQSYTLTTAINGSGTVARNPTGTSFPGGSDVILTATPASGNQFAGWTGALSGTTNPATVRMLANTTVTANFVPTGTGGTGTVLREYWLNVQGTTISSLTGAAAYPATPTGSEQLTSLEGAPNIGDQYGARVRGYLHPLVSGAYTFWLASDDAGDLLLSTNDNPANATRIAYVDSWTDPRQWTKLASQRSASINLVAGQKYYVEILHKEATGGDHFAVSWQGPGITQSVIGGNFLSPFVPSGNSNFTLSVTKSGAGGGTVTSSPGGINCGSSCSAPYASGVSVTLTAAAASGSTFAGWSGACTGTSTCTVSMTAARAVTATFNSSTTTFALSVTKSGSGAGTVSSSPSGVSCGSTCSANFASGTSVTLTAAASSGSAFAGWGGACSGTGSCTVSMTAARAVTVTFNTASTFALSVTRAGTGTGSVTSSPSGIGCGSTCSANYASGASVTLTAAAASGSTFAGWSGACSGTSTCTVSMTVARAVTATFNTSGTTTFTATVTRSGNGAGTVTSSPAGVSCGTLCSFAFNSGASVTFTAAPSSGSVFAGWGGACSGSASTCTVSMTAARAVTATFNLSGGTDTCANPVTFTGNSGNFNTAGAACFRTNATVNGWGCYNFDGRTVTVSGVARTCGQLPLTRAADGYYYFSVTAGQFPWAGLVTW